MLLVILLFTLYITRQHCASQCQVHFVTFKALAWWWCYNMLTDHTAMQ